MSEFYTSVSEIFLKIPNFRIYGDHLTRDLVVRFKKKIKSKKGRKKDKKKKEERWEEEEEEEREMLRLYHVRSYKKKIYRNKTKVSFWRDVCNYIHTFYRKLDPWIFFNELNKF